MKKIPGEIARFFYNQGFVIVCTIDKYGRPHSSCKGVVKINQNGRVFLLDVYRAQTFENLTQNPAISITAIDEHKFTGYCLKGEARIASQAELTPELQKAWENKIAGRLTQRLLKNIHEEKGHPRHPEALLPKPEYLIVMDVEEAIDLTPRHLKHKQ